MPPQPLLEVAGTDLLEKADPDSTNPGPGAPSDLGSRGELRGVLAQVHPHHDLGGQRQHDVRAGIIAKRKDIQLWASPTHSVFRVGIAKHARTIGTLG